ncbi:MAG: response regulator [Planctomycetota bacterium]
MPKIMIVDDTAVDRTLAGGLLSESEATEVVYATHGKEALELIPQESPDAILTDMQMPEMDGLQLVTEVHDRFPHIPVVLMTGQGSEMIAVDALERGAASYVPKKYLAKKLCATMEEVLALSRQDQSYELLTQCQQRVEFQYDLDNDPRLIDALVELTQQIMRGTGLLNQTQTVQTGMAFREAMLNSLYHGNLEITTEQMEQTRESLIMGGDFDIVAARQQEAPYCDRKIHVSIVIDREHAEFVVQDEGHGFNYAEQLTNLDLGSEGSLVSESGRGFVLMLSFMDEVSFNDTGNCVTMVKRPFAED